MRAMLRYAGFVVVLGALAAAGFAVVPGVPGATQQILTSSAVADSFVSGSGSDGKGSNGSATYLELKASPPKAAYLKFSVSGLSGPPSSATLRIYTLDNSSVGFDVRGVSDTSWDEGSLSYANAPAPSGTVTASSGALQSGTWVTLDVSSIVRGNGTYSFALTTTSPRSIDLASRESGARAPQLAVAIPSATTSPTTTGSSSTSNGTTTSRTTTTSPTSTSTTTSTTTTTPPTSTQTTTTTPTSTATPTTTPTSTTTTTLPTSTQTTTTPPTSTATTTTPTSTTTTTTPQDVTPPTAPSSVAITGATTSSVSISWSRSTDNVGVAGYELYRGSTDIGTTTQTSYSFTGLSCGASYTVGVDAFDGAGNTSARVALVVATSACPDTSAPTTPTGLTVTAATTTSISLSWTASTDDVAVAGYDVFLNGTKAGSTASVSYGFSGLTCATTYTLSVEAYDAAGNRSQRVSLVAVTSPCPDTTPPTTPSYVTVSAASTTTVSVLWGLSFDDVGVSGYEVFVNGAKVGSTSVTSYVFSGLRCGTTYALGVRAYDAAGNRSPLASASSTTAPCPLAPAGLSVSGNRLVDATGNPVQLHGVNYSGPEYACIQGWGIFDGPSDAASVSAMKAWNVNVVHLGLNEDCILGINGAPAAYSGSNYMNAIVAYVNNLHAQGLYAEVSLMWAAPGTQKALDHPAILDADHSAAALKAIANAFKSEPNTFIGLQSEPHAISWACWKNGGSSCSVGYTALGMQAALDAVRSTGATNMVTASGIDYANNLSQWLTYKPTDPLNQLVAEAHVYGGNSCSSTSCFDANYAPVAASVPLVFGETGETYDASSCGSSNVSTFMNWADAHNVGYEAWVWDTWGDCSSLISNYNGTPANTYGTYVKNHYLSRP